MRSPPNSPRIFLTNLATIRRDLDHFDEALSLIPPNPHPPNAGPAAAAKASGITPAIEEALRQRGFMVNPTTLETTPIPTEFVFDDDDDGRRSNISWDAESWDEQDAAGTAPDSHVCERRRSYPCYKCRQCQGRTCGRQGCYINRMCMFCAQRYPCPPPRHAR